jgi:hypothetical protein
LLHQFRAERSGVALTKKGAHHAQIGWRLINITANGVAASHRSVRCDWVRVKYRAWREANKHRHDKWYEKKPPPRTESKRRPYENQESARRT